MSKLRVYFLDLNRFTNVSYGVLSLVDALSQQGYPVRIAGSPRGLSVFFSDWVMPEHAAILERDIRGFKPDVFGISAFSTTANVLPNALAFLAKRFPEIPRIVGGVHCLVCGERILEDFGDADFGFRGEGEEQFPVFLERLAANGKDYSDIPGVIYRKDGRIHSNSPPDPVDFSEIIPARAFAHVSKQIFYAAPQIEEPVVNSSYFVPLVPPVDVVMLSRGCPYKCTFCQYLQNPYRGMRYLSPDAFKKQLDYSVNVLQAKSIYIYDSAFNLNLRWAEDIVNIIESEKRIFEWGCQFRPNLVNERFVRRLRKARCNLISLYPENSIDRIRNDILAKQVTDEELLSAYNIVKKHNFFVRANVILGNPTETAADIAENIRFIENYLPDQTNFVRLFVLPGTELERKVKEREYLSSDGIYIKSQMPDQIYESLILALNVQFSYFAVMARKKLSVREKKILIIQTDSYDEDGTPFGQFLVPFDQAQILGLGLYGTRMSSGTGCSRADFLLGPDVRFNSTLFPSQCGVMTAPALPVELVLDDHLWEELRDNEYDILAATVPGDCTKRDRLLQIANILGVRTLVMIEIARGIVFEYEIQTKVLSQYEFNTDLTAVIGDRMQGSAAKEGSLLAGRQNLIRQLDHLKKVASN